MKALTIWQPWASLILSGAKIYEFRRWPTPMVFRGERIVIHAAQRPLKAKEVADLLNHPDRLSTTCGIDPTDGARFGLAHDLLQRWWTNQTIEGDLILPRACGLGTAVLGDPKRCTDLFDGILDRDDIDPVMWAWPLADVQPFEAPIPARGYQGFWEWNPLAGAPSEQLEEKRA